MTGLRIGSLCTGYGGLDIAVENVLGGRVVWYSEIEKHPSTLLSERFPGITNLGDLTRIDWSAVPPVDVLTGGYPCQWMMGLPEGWINDISIPYGAKIKLCGNGVVPQQAEYALRKLIAT